jgi:hypothetical protein
MFEVKNGNTIHYFTKKADADIYSDFLLNGLKVIRREGKTIYFNDFSRLFNVSLPNEKPERFVLKKSNNRTVTDKRQIKKYLLAANQ